MSMIYPLQVRQDTYSTLKLMEAGHDIEKILVGTVLKCIEESNQFEWMKRRATRIVVRHLKNGRGIGYAAGDAHPLLSLHVRQIRAEVERAIGMAEMTSGLVREAE